MSGSSDFEPLYCYDADGNAYLIGGPKLSGPADSRTGPRRAAICAAWIRPVAMGRRLTFGRARRRPGTTT